MSWRSTNGVCEQACKSILGQRFQTENAWGLEVEGVEGISDERTKVVGAVIETQIEFDIRRVFKSSRLGKKKIALELLMEGFHKVCAHFGWPIGPLEKARDCVIEKNYRNEWVWKSLWNRNRRYRAQVWCDHDIDKFTIFLELYNKAEERLARQVLLEKLPSEFCFVQYVGALEWRSRTVVRFTNRDRTHRWIMRVEPKIELREEEDSQP